jgi:nucleoside-diphosphate-sugar epimerase
MRVMVTGGTGSVGKAAVRRLVQDGWDVRVVGRRSGVELVGAEYAACDVTCFEDLCRQIAGCDAVVHLAAVAGPTGAAGCEIIRVNVLGTFHVFEAAAKAGVGRIVQASSINAFGCYWGVVDLQHVQYFPIDEQHPTCTTDAYSFSKELIERIGDYYWRREGITSIALRLPWVCREGYPAGEEHRRRVQQARLLLDEVAALPRQEQLARLDAARATAMAFRRQRPFEQDARAGGVRRRHLEDDPLARMYLADRANFWAFVDERDAAQAIARSLTADRRGSHVLFVNDPHNWLLYETEKLLSLFFPDVTRRKRPVEGSQSLVSIDKARELIGFDPEHSVAGVA